MITPSKPAISVILLLGALLAAPATRADVKEPPVPVRTVAPDYPTIQRRAGICGVVTIRCTIDIRGDVIGTEVMKVSDPAFEQPALEALQKWKFKPATLDGVAVQAKAVIPVKFVVNS